MREARSRSRVLIAGVSTRSAAASAARAGYAVTAIDAFADLDQHRSVHAIIPPDGYSPASAARAGRNVECDAVVYVSGFENHPEQVAALAANRHLWGNPPELLQRVRDPVAVTRAFQGGGHPSPAVHQGGRGRDRGEPEPEGGRWLAKPLAAGGGHGVRHWRPGQGLPQGCYIQEFVRGIPGSVVFVASGGRAVPLGVSLQLVGEPEFGADGFRYCGSILAPRRNGPFSAELIDAACALASTAAREFGLVGVNGIDFVARGHVPYPVEVNPRWCSSVELVERAHRISVFSAHVATCTAGALPDGFDLRRQPGRAETLGKAVVFARHDIVTGDTRSWTDREDMSDIPHPGETIRAGRPVCTVFAAGEDSVRCRARLVDRAGQVYATLASWAEAQVRG